MKKNSICMSMKRYTFFIAGLVALSLAVTEGFARYELGLGDPPLTIRDPDIDYLFAPSKTYHRFGNTIRYNAFSMRSDDVTLHKLDPAELRVIVMGDSVINGGALTDDYQLATRLAQTWLAELLRRPVWVGNISAGSWGPGNLLAYVRKYGWFDADVALLFLSSHDVTDVPDFRHDLGVDFPDEAPWLALEEGLTRYMWPYAGRYLPEAITQYLPKSSQVRPTVEVNPRSSEDRDLEEGRRLLAALLTSAKSSVPFVAVIHHLEQTEIRNGLHATGVLLDMDVATLGIPLLRLTNSFSTDNAANMLYRDNIHLTAFGQRLYADVIVCAVRALLTTQQVEVCRAAQTDLFS